MIYAAALLLGPTVIGRMSCGFFLLMEQVPKRYQQITGALLMIAEGSTVLIWVVYLVWIDRNCVWMVWFIVAVNIFAAIGTFFVYESPRYLFGMERYE